MKRADNSPYQWLSILCVPQQNKTNHKHTMEILFTVASHSIQSLSSVIEIIILDQTSDRSVFQCQIAMKEITSPNS